MDSWMNVSTNTTSFPDTSHPQPCVVQITRKTPGRENHSETARRVLLVSKPDIEEHESTSIGAAWGRVPPISPSQDAEGQFMIDPKVIPGHVRRKLSVRVGSNPSSGTYLAVIPRLLT